MALSKTLRLERPRGAWADPQFRAACAGAATFVLVALSGIIIFLTLDGWPALQKFGFAFFTSTEWNPVTDIYGAAGPIVGTLISSALAQTIALPQAMGIAVFLVEFCPRVLSRPVAGAGGRRAGGPAGGGGRGGRGV